MNAPVADALAGELIATPGRAEAPLRSSRRELAPLLGRGRKASELPALLSAAFSLCGGAHRATAAAAVIAAQELPAARRWPSPFGALQRDTLCEHLRRIALDWPRVHAWPDERAGVAWLASCPLLRNGLVLPAGRPWIESEVLGLPVELWLGHWDEDADAFGDAWAREGRTPVARWLAAAARQLSGLAAPLRALPAPDDRPMVHEFVQRLRAEPDFALIPLWHGETAETGPWTRRSDNRIRQRRDGGVPLMHRLMARVAEIARLAVDGGTGVLQHGAATIGAGEGLAWCEMARGLLVHWVRLAPVPAGDEPRVDAVRVLAPTEWNFHPRGAFARLLAQLPGDAPQALVELAAAAFDPCVTLHTERATDDQEPRCTR